MDHVLLGAEEVAVKEFPIAFRGFAQHEVRAFLAQVAAELAAARERERLQRERLEAAEERAASRPLSDAEVEVALGHEAGQVLQAARQAATEIRARAEEQVERLVRDASGEGSRLQDEAESLLVRRTEEADRAAEEIRSEAERSAEAEVEQAKARGREMVAEAQAVRERVLKDLARRRRVAHQQLEQLRAGRERLLEAYRVVRSTLDEATKELSAAEAEARVAAEMASLRMGAQPETTVDELEAELSAARDIGLDLLAPSPTGPARSGAGASASDVPADDSDPSAPPEPSDEHEDVPDVPDALEAPDEGSPVSLVSSGPPGTEPAGELTSAAGDIEDEVGPVPEVPSVAEELPEPQPEPEPEPAPEPEPEPEPAAFEPEPLERSPELEPVSSVAGDGGPPVGSVAVDAAGEVEELFARLRSERAAAVASAEEVLAEPAPAPEPVPVMSNGAVPTTVEHGNEAAVPVPPARDDDDVLQVRDAEIEPVERALIKALKRALADEQNEVLDTLRRCRGPAALDDLLPGPTDHTARYLAVATSNLDAASGSGAGPGGKGPSIGDLAANLAAEVVDDLRARLQRALEASDGDEARLVDGISAAYREWKTSRAEPSARHHVVAAHNRGRFATAADGPLRWVLDAEEGPCPDCEDNSLAGATPKGSPFPTGQEHPPAHVGCRCTIVAGAG